MALQWEGQNIGTIRDAVEGDEGYAPGLAAIFLADGTMKCVNRSEIKTEAQQEEERLEAETAPDVPPAEPPPVTEPPASPPP